MTGTANTLVGGCSDAEVVDHMPLSQPLFGLWIDKLPVPVFGAVHLLRRLGMMNNKKFVRMEEELGKMTFASVMMEKFGMENSVKNRQEIKIYKFPKNRNNKVYL